MLTDQVNTLKYAVEETNLEIKNTREFSRHQPVYLNNGHYGLIYKHKYQRKRVTVKSLVSDEKLSDSNRLSSREQHFWREILMLNSVKQMKEKNKDFEYDDGYFVMDIIGFCYLQLDDVRTNSNKPARKQFLLNRKACFVTKFMKYGSIESFIRDGLVYKNSTLNGLAELYFSGTRVNKINLKFRYCN